MKRLLLSGTAAMVKRIARAPLFSWTLYFPKENETAQHLINYFLPTGVIASLKFHSDQKYIRGASRPEDAVLDFQRNL
jgi:hypothetical protein